MGGGEWGLLELPEPPPLDPPLKWISDLKDKCAQRSKVKCIEGQKLAVKVNCTQRSNAITVLCTKVKDTCS